MLPNFLVAGTSRAGSTYLYSLLIQHPDIYLPSSRVEGIPSTKDTHFFDHLPGRGQPMNIEEYARNFEDHGGKKAVGEVATSYIYFDWVPKMLHDYLGSDIKLIFLLRDPVKRTYANYWQSLIVGRETLSFEESLKREPERIKQDYENAYRYSYIDRSMYMKQIKRFQPYFARENMLFIISEQMYKDSPGVIDRISDFLEIPRCDTIDYTVDRNHMPIPEPLILYRHFKRLKQNMPEWPGMWRLKKLAKVGMSSVRIRDGKYPPMKPQTAAWLTKVFREDVRELQEYLDVDLGQWWPEFQPILAKSQSSDNG